MLFSNHQNRDEGYFDLFFSFSFAVVWLTLFCIEWTCSIFSKPLPFGAVCFLKISKFFQFLTCFSFHCSFTTSSKAFQSLQKQLGRTHNRNHPLGTSSLVRLLTLQLLLWSSLTSSWLPAGESWLSSHHNSLFNRMLLSNDLCSVSFTGGDELSLACHLRYATKHLLKIASEPWQYPAEPRGDQRAGRVQRFKWGGVCAQGDAVLNQDCPLDLWQTKKSHCLTSISIAATVHGQFIPMSCTTSTIVSFSLLPYTKKELPFTLISILLLSS